MRQEVWSAHVPGLVTGHILASQVIWFSSQSRGQDGAAFITVLTDEETEIRGGTYKAQVSQSGTVQAVREPRHPALPGPGLTGEAPSWRNAWEFAEPSGALPPFSAEGF